MLPVLFHIGKFELRSWGLAFAISVALGVWVASRRGNRFGIKANEIMDFSIVVVLASLIGSRLWYVAFHLNEFRGKWLNIVNPFQEDYFGIAGMSMIGGVVLAIVGAVLYAWKKKMNFGDIGDAMGPSFLLGAGIQRLGGCFLHGCCFGRPTDSWFGVVFPPDGVAGSFFRGIPLHPTQLYASALGFIGFALVLWLERWHRFKGYTAWLVFIYYVIDRFIVDQFRYYETPQVLGSIGPLNFNVNDIF